jgi:hypothetical protein
MPTVRRAELHGEQKDAQQANAGGRKAAGNLGEMVDPSVDRRG